LCPGHFIMRWLDSLLGLSVKELEWYQMVLRAIIIYVVALTYIRIAGMRSFGTSSAFDVVVTITMGAVLSRTITGHYPFFPCVITALVLALCHRAFAFASFKWHPVQKAIEGEPVLLFTEGVFVKKNSLFTPFTRRILIAH